ncbi:DMT family transporter [Streptomyces sp. NPDC007983]|uniref:EamA family transporter n=1 Tax=Streptomyces sp. NPDC007983 TaxID=3364800 RepID=UPI0036E43D5A
MLIRLASGASMACSFLLSHRAGGRDTGGAPLASAVAWAAVLTVPLGVWENGTALLAPRALAIGLGAAVLSAVLPYSLELAALRRLPARAVAVLAGLEPATAGLAGTVVPAEHLRPEQWVALGCVGAASAGTVARGSPGRRSGRSGAGPDRPGEDPPVGGGRRRPPPRGSSGRG